MAGIQLTEVDFSQIKENLIDYLKSTGKFTDYDFSGSNLQVILDLISYQAQMNAYSANMVANEAFLSSATLRNNVVAHAQAQGYTPVSAKSASTVCSFTYTLSALDYPSGFPLYLEVIPGSVLSTSNGSENLTFNVVDRAVASVSGNGVCFFSNIETFEGTYLTDKFTVDQTVYNQKLIIQNANVDTSTIRIEVQEDPNEDFNEFYAPAKELVNVQEDTRCYWITEVEDGFYQITFGDGVFGRKLQDGAVVNVSYIITNGEEGNGIGNRAGSLSFVGTTRTATGAAITERPVIDSSTVSTGGAAIEDVASIKLRAPRSTSAQNRCVVAEDYEAIVRQVFPAIDDVYVFGGEQLDPPVFGRVYIIIKPSSGAAISNRTRSYIKKSLDSFRVASLDLVIQDAEILYVEVVSTAYYDTKRTNKGSAGIVAAVNLTLNAYGSSSTLSKFGGAVRFSRVAGSIDDADRAITRNNSSLRMRRDVTLALDTAASYEVCYENQLKTDTGNSVVYSSGFNLRIDGVVDQTVYYFEDDSEGYLYRFHLDSLNNKIIDDPRFGTVDYTRGEVKFGYGTPITFVNSLVDGSTLEVRGIPARQDVVASKNVYAEFDVSKSTIVAIPDQEIAGS